MDKKAKLVDWLETELKKTNLDSRVHQNLIREDGGWFYVPVYVAMANAYEKAVLLQEIEDKWEAEQKSTKPSLLLMPAAN